MKNKTNFGFTLIELLIVIAIIGVITSIVMVSVNVARGKAANASVKQNLHGIGSQAEIFYDNNSGTYSDFCTDASVIPSLEGAGLAGSGVATSTACFDSSAGWAAQARFKVQDSGGFTYWCVDNAGTAKGETIPLAGSSCP